MTGAINMALNKITNLGAGSLSNDAVNKSQMDTADGLKVSKSGDTMTGALVLSGDPTANL
jgi:hypothetical protein